jgi:hypothetical protein
MPSEKQYMSKPDLSRNCRFFSIKRRPLDIVGQLSSDTNLIRLAEEAQRHHQPARHIIGPIDRRHQHVAVAPRVIANAFIFDCDKRPSLGLLEETGIGQTMAGGPLRWTCEEP